MLMPGSDWLSGVPWMNMPIEKAIQSGVIKNTNEIKLTNNAKKVFREGIIHDPLVGINVPKTTSAIAVQFDANFAVTPDDDSNTPS